MAILSDKKSTLAAVSLSLAGVAFSGCEDKSQAEVSRSQIGISSAPVPQYYSYHPNLDTPTEDQQTRFLQTQAGTLQIVHEILSTRDVRLQTVSRQQDRDTGKAGLLQLEEAGKSFSVAIERFAGDPANSSIQSDFLFFRTELHRVVENLAGAGLVSIEEVNRFRATETIATATFLFDRWNPEHDSIIPEYKDQLNFVTLAVDAIDDSLNWQTQFEILKALPEHTQITLEVPADRLEEVDTALRQLDFSESIKARISFRAVFNPRFNNWPQDTSLGDHQFQIAPLPFHFFDNFSTTSAGGAMSPNQFYPHAQSVSAHSPDIKGIEIPVVFEGGNVFLAENKVGEAILLTGSSDFLNSREAYQLAGLDLSREEFQHVMQKAFGVDEVRIIGPSNEKGELLPQPGAMFHLDLCLLPTGPGEIMMLSPELPFERLTQEEAQHEFNRRRAIFEDKWKDRLEDPLIRGETVFPENQNYRDVFPSVRRVGDPIADMAREFSADLREVNEPATKYRIQLTTDNYADILRQYQEQLSDFDLINLPTLSSKLFSRESYTNAIIFTHPVTEQRHAIVSDFVSSDPSPRDIILQEQAIKVFQSNGFEVTPVRDRASARHHGGPHCLSSRR